MADALGNVDTFDYALRAGGKMYAMEYASDGTLPDSYVYLGETHNINKNVESEQVEIMNTEACTQSVGASSTKSSKLTLDWETFAYSPENLAIAFLGTVTSTTQSALTASAVTIENVQEGEYSFIGSYACTVLVVMDSTDTDTYVLGTDYTFDADSGMLGIIAGGGIDDDDDLHLTVTSLEYISDVVQYLDNVTKEFKLMFIGCPSDGIKYKTEFYKVKVTANGAIGMKGDEYIPISMIGTAVADTSQATGSEYATVTVLPST